MAALLASLRANADGIVTWGGMAALVGVLMWLRAVWLRALPPEPESNLIDGEYRVRGESRWGPFRRWLKDMAPEWPHDPMIFTEEFHSWNNWTKLFYVVALAILFGALAWFAYWMHHH